MWELQRFRSDAEVPNWLRSRHYEGCFWLVEPKSKQGNRFVPVSNQTWLGLWALVGRRQCQPGQLIFTREGHPLTNTVERRRWKRSLEDAGLPCVTIRSARHFFSTHLAEAGAPEDARKAIMGHAKISTTAGYTHWSAASLAALADKARQAVGIGLIAILARPSAARTTTGAGGVPSIDCLRQPAASRADQCVRFRQMISPRGRIARTDALADLLEAEISCGAHFRPPDR